MALSLRILGAVGMLLCQIVLARSLGVVGFGDYSQTVAWIQFLCIFGKCGLDNSSLRFVSEYVTVGETSRLRGFVRDSTRVSLLASLLTSVAVIAYVATFKDSIGETLAQCLTVGSLMIPLISLRQIHEASLRGFGRITESQLSFIVWPFTLVLMTTFIWIVMPGYVSSTEAIQLHLVSVCLVSAMVYFFFRRSKSRMPLDASPVTSRQIWAKTASAFFIAELLIALKGRVCVAMAGVMLGSDSAGVYAAMERFAEASLLGSQSLGLIIAPQFASMFAAGRYKDMRRLLWRGQLLGLAFTLPVAIAVACFGPVLFRLLGKGYEDGWAVLLMLLGSACITSLAGPSAYVLQMTGRERSMLLITGACAISNVLLSLLLVRPFGIIGFGIAQMITSLVWTVGIRLFLLVHPAWQEGVSDRVLHPNQIDTEEPL